MIEYDINKDLNTSARTPEVFNETITHDFSYTPTDVTKEKSFDQREKKKVIEKKLYKPIDHPNADPMPISHVFGPNYSGLGSK